MRMRASDAPLVVQVFGRRLVSDRAFKIASVTRAGGAALVSEKDRERAEAIAGALNVTMTVLNGTEGIGPIDGEDVFAICGAMLERLVKSLPTHEERVSCVEDFCKQIRARTVSLQ